MTLCSRKQVWKEIEKPMEVERKIVSLEALYIVYDADGTVAGELLYLLRKWLGKGHCAACDITHGPRKVKPEWTILQKTGWLGVPLFNIHRDEMEPKLRSAVSCALPCVAALVDNGDYVLLLQPEDLESCKGQVSKLQEKIVEALKDFGFQVNESFTKKKKRMMPLSPFSFSSVVCLSYLILQVCRPIKSVCGMMSDHRLDQNLFVNSKMIRSHFVEYLWKFPSCQPCMSIHADNLTFLHILFTTGGLED
ncbi:hypothetical protein Gasu2_43290 [Galdieria sulphuraria]|nr:hypothetical protein Gasu2_43290 [Galdieria sulphuraria]